MPNALYLIDQNGDPIGVTGNPLEVSSGGGGGGTVDQGETNGDATKGWSFRLTDGSAFVSPATSAGQATGNASLSSIDTKLTNQATAAKQDTANASLASIDAKLTNPLPVSETGNAATPTRSFVNASASSVTLLAANSSRQSASFFNNSNVDLYLREDGGTADTTTGFTAILRANGGYYELPIGADRSITRGAITGIWTSAGSSGVAVCERV